MDRFRQKSKKEKPIKYVDKDQSALFITDVKAMKENLKIKEILRTVKMNSSMRIKAPKGSKVMQNKDFNDNEDMFGTDQNGDGQNSENQSSENQNSEDQNIMEPPSATNPDVVVSSNTSEDTSESKPEEPEDKVEDSNESEGELVAVCDENNSSVDAKLHESISVPEGLSDFVLISEENKQNIPVVPDVKIDFPPPSHCAAVKARDRKLSLDHTMLSRRGGLSQSEFDLNSIGKSPLERKSSFFRKKMDSFLKNTTEIFKRQSISRSQSIQRRGSMSVSLQSLNEGNACNGDYGEPLHNHPEELQKSMSSLQSSPTPARSVSSSSMCRSEQNLPDQQSEGDSLAGSRPMLAGSQFLGDISPSIHSLNDEAYIQEAMLNRAISMSSGLDSATGQNRRKSRSNRVTWLASEGLTNYLRRVIQDEKTRELGKGHSYQDFSSIPENMSSEKKTDSKGRRLSYQRAVSGEDPRFHEHNIRRKQLIPENSEVKCILFTCYY
ncbi:hypothetical protein PYW08_000397 [Mythimna loreyi]|uniref:Uncharacterized protein n=1 Tax=Mythimna loreyi TaxID=667449 RepID=A0ACC2RCD4_9NEOP|nr:hypothetical protein PYW08_000397 [Mythimna loreyi]